MSSERKYLRNFAEDMPDELVCPLCNTDNKDCECVKYNCKCKITATNCIWPDCICSNCLQLQDKCVCINEQ